MISQQTIARLSERAGDVGRRTFVSGAQAAAQPIDLAGLAADFETHGAPAAQGLMRVFGRMSNILGALGGAVAMGPSGPVSFGAPARQSEPGPPPSEQAIRDAERRIGRPFPAELRQLYAIADGGFGPGEGLFSLAELGDRYAELTDKPFGPLDQLWPAHLLPLFDQDPALLCLDLVRETMVFWDPEEIEDEDSDEDWQRSFVDQGATLAQTMDRWIDEPTFQESTADMFDEARRKHEAAPKSPVTGWPITLDLPTYVEGEIVALAHSESLRQDAGLPDHGWEDEVRRRHGLG